MKPNNLQKKLISCYNNIQNFNSKKSRSIHCGLWDDTTTTIEQANLNTNKALAEALKINSNSIVLDAGCGMGGTSLYLAEKYGANVTGITIVPRQLKAARRFKAQSPSKNKVKFFEQDYTNTKFDNNHFTHVFGIESICYADPLDSMIKESYRILKPGGKFASLDGYLTSKSKVHDPVYKEFLKGFVIKDLYIVNKLKTKLKKVGFKNIRFINKTKQVKPSTEYYYKTANKYLPFLRFASKIKIYPQNAADYLNSVRLTKIMIDKNIIEYGIVIAEK